MRSASARCALLSPLLAHCVIDGAQHHIANAQFGDKLWSAWRVHESVGGEARGRSSGHRIIASFGADWDDRLAHLLHCFAFSDWLLINDHLLHRVRDLVEDLHDVSLRID